MEMKKRVDWIDAAKGTGILLIVGIHSIRPDMREAQAVCKFIYDVIISFVIGMFLVLSGVTYRLSDGGRFERPKQFMYKKARTLLLPFFGYALLIYGLFSFAVWCPFTARIFQGTEYGGMPPGKYLRLTLCADSPYAAHLWFIWVLFWIIMAVCSCDLLCKRWELPRQKVLWCAAAVLCVVGFRWQGDNSVVQRVLTHTVYFVYGTELAACPRLLKHNSIYSKALVALSAGITLGYAAGGWHAVTWYGEILWQICWLAVRLTLIWGIIRLAMWLKDVKWLTYLGRESFWVYLLHQPFCCGFVGLLLYSRLGLPIPLVCTVCIVLGVSLPLCAVWFGRRILH